MQVDFKKAPVARRVQKRGQTKKAHFLAPARGAQLLQLESRLEASAAVVLGLDPRVKSIRSQPMCFDLSTGRVFATKDDLFAFARQNGMCPTAYTPDFEVITTRNLKVLIEVKHSALIAKKPNILLVPNILARHGHRLIIVDEILLDETLVRNMRTLSVTKYSISKPTDLERLRDFCIKPVQISNLIEANFSERLIIAALANGVITCDLRSARISRRTLVQTSVATAAPQLMEIPLEY